MYHVETADIYKDTVESKELYDMSNFKPSNTYYQPDFAANKAVVGKMKDETEGDPIVEFVGLRPKMYCFEGVHINADGSRVRFQKHRAKGIQRPAAENIYHKNYLEQLKNATENYALTCRLGSRLHQI